jgi:hypothetical protein
MKTMWNEKDCQEIRQRFGRLRPDAKGQWGKMDAPRMVVHLTDSLKMTLGELPVASKKMPLRYPPLKQLFIYVLPFPKSAPTAPELVSRAPREWAVEMAELEAAVERFTAQPPGREWPEHPAFGRLTREAWGTLIYRHTHHHLRQFGA